MACILKKHNFMAEDGIDEEERTNMKLLETI